MYAVTAVNSGSLLHLRGDAQESTAEQPDSKCLVKCCVDKDQADNAVGKMERHHNLVDTDEKYNRCKHLGNNNKSQKSSLAFEFHSGQGISSRNTADHSQKSGASCDHNGVHHVIAHGSQLPYVCEVGPDGLNRENSSIHGKDFRAAFKSSTYSYKIWV